MRLKLDENLGHAPEGLLRVAGHDVATVHSQRMGGASDIALIRACRSERRALVTLDMEFANPLVFRPGAYAGIVVLRLPPESSAAHVLDAVRTLVAALPEEDLSGKLWVVSRGRVREHQEFP